VSGRILRYTLIERAVHWVAALTYDYVLLTGLAFYSPHLYWIATLLGGPATSRYGVS
jgi:formate dehydrogenase subunit gamma